jgi:ABC-type bacteriocin/lantibiotic exporter with double-glycine peptidase domain
MKIAIKFILPYWKKGIIPVLFLLISTFISFVFPLFPKWAIDDVVIKKNYDKLLFLAIAFLILILFQRLFSYLNEITFFKFQKKSILSIQKKLLKKVFYYPMEFFDKNHSGYLMGRIRGDVAGLSYIFSSGLVMFFMDFVKFIGTFIILLTMNVKLTLISICILPFLMIKIINSKSSMRKINEKILEENARLEKELSDSFQGIEVLKSFSKEEEGIKRTGDALSDYQKIEVKRNVILSKYGNIIDFIVHLGEVLLLYFGIREVISGNLSIGGYIAFSGYLIYLYSPIRNLSNVMIFFDYAKRSYDRIKELLDILPEDIGNLEVSEIEKIEVKGLSFSYNGKDGVIKDLNFEINKRDKVLIEGESGSGKSTLIKLILGLYRPQKGEVNINGINLKEININKLREKFGYISQNIFLFNKTLRENLIFNSKNITDDKLLNLIQECRLDIKIKSLKKGLDEIVSEKGANFSGGEKQRIALVRAMIKDPDVIIIDEGTSNIDIKTEQEILKIVEKKFKDKIIIRITHREVKAKNWIRINI